MQKRAVTWIIGVALVLVIFGALEAVRRALEDDVLNRVANASHNKLNKLKKLNAEGMIGGLNVTSDDLVGYTESSAYGDKSDSKVYSDIAWKIKNCSTITNADVNRAVNDAVSKVRREQANNCRC